MNTDLITLKREGYDPNEPDPNLFNDSVPLDLAELEHDTLQLYLLDKETNDIVPLLSADEILPSLTMPVDVPTLVGPPPALADFPPNIKAG